MRQFINLIGKLLAGFYCINCQVLYYKNLKLTFPSISFSMNPFRLFKGSKVTMGKRAMIGKRCEIIAIGQIKIGENFCINKYSRIVAHQQIVIGNDVTIAQFVSILDHDHAYEIINGLMKLTGYSLKNVTIGNNVWIGDKVTICKGVTIGNNVIIGANSLVNKDIKSNCIAAGNPCRKIKTI